MLAIGPNRAPAGPVIANRGRKAQTMIIVEKNSGRSISCEASAIRSISGRDRSAPVRRDVAVDVLDDDHRAVDDDPEVDRADREQVGRLPLQVEDGDREQQGQRDRPGPRSPALARSPRKTKRTATTRAMPTTRLCSTLCVVTWTRSVRWLKTTIFIPLGRSSSRSISSHLLGDGLGRRAATSRTSASGRCPRRRRPRAPRPTIPSRGRWPTITWATCRT